jgi:hypothetical protein
MRLLSGVVSFSELKNLQNELRCWLDGEKDFFPKCHSTLFKAFHGKSFGGVSEIGEVEVGCGARMEVTNRLLEPRHCWPGSADAREGNVRLSESGTIWLSINLGSYFRLTEHSLKPDRLMGGEAAKWVV